MDIFNGIPYYHHMQYLTPNDLRKIAPATQKMPESDENLVSTKAFLRRVEKLGFQPIFAAQGTAHADADAPLKSRHLMVAADKSGFAVAILNSHSIWRRAWIGVGFADIASRFVIGAAVPLPRWRGFEEPLETALSYKDTLVEARTVLDKWTPDVHQRRWLSKQFAASAWLTGHKQPLPKALLSTDTSFATDLLVDMLALARAGGLPPMPRDSFKAGRKLKPIIAPDALFHAASQTFQVGLRGLKKYKLGEFEFPAHTTSR